jgi:hypothetical protein
MLRNVFLEKPLGINPVEDEKQRGSHQYAYQELLHGQNWK